MPETNPEPKSDVFAEPEEVKIKEIYLSAGDTIQVTVYKHDELAREITIDQNNQFYYPMAGYIDVTDKSLSQIRKFIAEKISEYKEEKLLPGDEIVVSIFNYSQLNRTFVIPPDGYIFFPLLGEINTTGKTIRELRQTIIKGLEKYRNYYFTPGDVISITLFPYEQLNRKALVSADGYIDFPFVGRVYVEDKTIESLTDLITKGLQDYKDPTLIPGDNLSVTVYHHDDLNRELVVSAEGYIFYPFAGEIDVRGKSIRDLRNILTEKLQVHVADAQIGVNLLSTNLMKVVSKPHVTVELDSSTTPKIVIDPEVAVDFVDLKHSNRIIDPDVGIDVTTFGGHKIFVFGEVGTPGIYTTNGKKKLLEAILEATGPTNKAELSTVMVARRGVNPKKAEVMVFDVEKAIEGDMSQDVTLRAGDVVYVPNAFITDVDEFFGHVTSVITPFIQMESGYFIYDQIQNRSSGGVSVPAP